MVKTDTLGQRYVEFSFTWASSGLVERIRYTLIPKTGTPNKYPEGDDLVRIKKFHDDGKPIGQYGVDITVNEFRRIHGEGFISELFE